MPVSSPALQIDEGAVSLPDDFQWGKEWVALRMWKELRDDGEYFFAACLRKFGPNDFGNKSKYHIYIGREVEWLGEKITDTREGSKTFGQRITKKMEQVTERIWDEYEKEWIEVKIPINATKTYKYLHKANDKELIKKYKTLVGSTPRSGHTNFTFIWAYGTDMCPIDKKEEFFDHTVKEMVEWVKEKKQTEAFKDDKRNTE